MRLRILALTLLLAVLPPSNAGVVSAKKSKVIDLVGRDGSKIATIHVNGESLLYEINKSDAFLFSDEKFLTLNTRDKTYRVQSYADLQSGASRKAVEIAQSPDSIDARQGVLLKLTDETDVVAGVKVRKLIKTSGGEPEAVFWVSSELTPPRLRALGEKIRSILPNDYWRRVHGNPGMVEIVMLFGVPLKVIYDGRNTYEARVTESPSSDSEFQVPEGYKRLDN